MTLSNYFHGHYFTRLLILPQLCSELKYKKKQNCYYCKDIENDIMTQVVLLIVVERFPAFGFSTV